MKEIDLVKECKRIRMSENYKSIRKFSLGTITPWSNHTKMKDSDKIDLDKFEKKAEDVAIRMRKAFIEW